MKTSGFTLAVSFFAVVATVGFVVAFLGYCLPRQVTEVVIVAPNLSATATAGVPVTPPVGAASLNLNQCGCASGGIGAPTCARERSWNISKSFVGNDTFSISTSASDRLVVRGTYVLETLNSGVSTTALTSVYMAIELPASSNGNAPGPSGKNWATVVSVSVSAAPACGRSARICNADGNSLLTNTSQNSVVVVSDANGNSIAVAGNGLPVPIPGPRDNDNDGRINEDSPDVSANGDACPGTNLTLDEDADGRLNEDGVCQDRVTFLLTYAFELTETQRMLLAGKAVRLNVLATFLANAERGATCVADTNCDGVLSAAEQNARTVQVRQPFTFPSQCAYRCECAGITDAPSYTTFGVGGQADNATQNWPSLTYQSPFPLSYCANGSRSVNTTIGHTCSALATAPTRTVVTNVASLVDNGLGCSGLFAGSPAEASFEFECPQAIWPSPSVNAPSPTAIPVPQPPPVSALCTYTSGIFTGNAACPTPNDVSVCALRHQSPRASCVRDACTAGPYAANVTYPITRYAASPVGAFYNVSFRSTNASRIDDIIAGIVRDNTATPGLFSASTLFTDAYLSQANGAFQTSARQLARQLVVALWNIQLTNFYDNSTSRDMLARLVFKGAGCGGVPVWLNSNVTLLQAVEFARFVSAINVQYFAAPANVSFQCAAVLGNTNPLCAILSGRVAPSFNDPLTGQSLASDLTRALTLYNEEYDNCNQVATGCLVLPVPL